jgi:hypothetical protein
MLIAANTAIMSKLNNQIENGIKTDFNMHEFKEVVEPKYSSLKKDVTKS